MPEIKHNPKTWLGKIRKKAGLTQAQMAEKLGMSPIHYLAAEKEEVPGTWCKKALNKCLTNGGLDLLTKGGKTK
jgi:DNA-binding XRE family transcriptional regulator